MKKEKYRIVKQVRKGVEEFSIEILYPVYSITLYKESWHPLGDLNTQRYTSKVLNTLYDNSDILQKHADRKIYSSEDDAIQSLNSYIDKLREEDAEKQQPFYYWTPITEIEG